MAKRELHAEAIELRKQGMSYTQIKNKIGVSKSTLSNWLRSFPSSEDRIRELRDTNEQRIERTRETKARKRELRHADIQKKVENEIGELTNREIFVAGLFLYWGEGTKTSPSTISVSNTDPSVVLFFIKWLALLGVSKEKVKVHLHLYSDMDIQKELDFWSKTLNVPLSAFRKPYIKSSKRAEISYVQKFTHGTCNVIYLNQPLHEYILASIEHFRSGVADISSS
jgi:predicted transcriptional regulator